jgi:hypothetical protein
MPRCRAGRRTAQTYGKRKMNQKTIAINDDMENATLNNQGSARTTSSGELTIFHYYREIPSFVKAELDRLYANLYSSLPLFAADGKLHQASTYVVRRGGELVTLLLFRLTGPRVDVINEVIRLEEEDVARFAQYIFKTFKKAQVISFRSIQINRCKLPFPFQQFNCLEDMVVDLPSSIDVYTRELSSKTRSAVRRKLKVITRDISSFAFRCLEGDAIQLEHVRDVMEFNKERMTDKNKSVVITDEQVARMFGLVREGGMIIAAYIDDKICAGVITRRIGNNFYELMVAHDPKYNNYSLGFLCNYRSICECITRGGKELHFLWGRYPYKFAFSAMPRELDMVAIYRSQFHFALNIGMATRTWIGGMRRRLYLWAHQMKQQNGALNVWMQRILSYKKFFMPAKPALAEE